MWRVLFSPLLVCFVALGTAWAQDVSKVRPDQPGDDEEVIVQRGRSRAAGRQPAGRPAVSQPRRQPAAARSQPSRGPRPAGEAGPPHERLVYVLENAPAADAASTLSKLLDHLREAGQLPHEVVVLPETVTNSLVISAAPKDLEEVVRLVKQLDRQRASVRVELLIAEVQESGRPAARSPRPASGEGRPGAGAGRGPQQPTRPFRPRSSGRSQLGSAWEGWDVGQEPVRPNAAVRLFEQAGPPGPARSTGALRQRLRAMQGSGQLEILSRPQVTALDNQPASIRVGQKIPVLRPAAAKEAGKAATLRYEEVGLTVGIWPRISPHGRVAMEISVEKSELGPVGQSTPAGVLESGRVLRLPRIESASLETTVNVADGESAVIGGLTVSSGPRQSKLLIVVTPHILQPK